MTNAGLSTTASREPVDPAAAVDSAPTPESTTPVQSRGGSKISTIAGILALLLASVLGITAAAILVVQLSVPDEEGFFMTPGLIYTVDTRAITSEPIELDGWATGLGEIKISSENPNGTPLFVGMALTADVDEYLRDVAHSTLETVRYSDGANDPTYRQHAGSAPRTPPRQQDFWIRASQGTTPQTMTFSLPSDSTTIVVMNADGSAGVSADIAAGVATPALGWTLIVLLVAAGIFLLVGLVLLLGKNTRADRA